MGAIQYIKNVGKSFGYAAIDVMKEYNPVITAAATQAKEYSTDLYHSIKDFSRSLNDKKSEAENSLVGDVKDTISDLWKNTKEDILSGNWYNKQRIKTNDDEIMSAMFGDMDFNFDDDFGDFDFDDELEDDTKAEISADNVSDMRSAKAIVSGVDIIGAKVSGAINSTTVKSAEYVAKSQERSSKAIYDLTGRGFNQVSVGLAAVNSHLSALTTLAEPLTLHMQNSATFFTKSTENQEKILEKLEKIVENTTVNKKEEVYGSSKKNKLTDLINADGVIDLKAYSEMVIGNIKNYTDIVKDIVDAMGGVKTAGKTITGSPLHFVLNGALKKMMPEMLKNSMKNFNDMLTDFFPLMLQKLKNTSFGALDIFKDIFVPQEEIKFSINPTRYYKGKASWDGKSKRALEYVIPVQLAKIISSLTGETPKLYNFETGRWITNAYLKKEWKEKEKRSAKYSSDASYEVDRILSNQVKANKISKNDKDRINNEFLEYLITAMKSGGDGYTKILDPNFKAKDWGMSEDTLQFIRAIINQKEAKGDIRFRNNMFAGVVRGRADHARSLEREEESGENMFHTLFDGSIFDMENQEKKDESFLSKMVDVKGNNIFFYLQGIYTYTQHLSNNIRFLGTGKGKIKGTKTLKNAKTNPDVKSEESTDSSTNNSSSSTSRNAASTVNTAGGVLDNLAEAIASESDRMDIRFMDPAVKEYYNKKNNSGLSPTEWKNSPDYNEDLEKKLSAALLGNKSVMKLKGWLGNTAIGKGINKLLESIGNLIEKPANRVAGLFNAASVSLNNFLYGEGKEGGLKDYFTKLFDDVKKKIFEGLFGTKGADGRFDDSKLLGRLVNNTKDTLKEAGSKVWGDVRRRLGFAKGGLVTKTGLTAVSRGEYIIPSGRASSIDKEEEIRSIIKRDYAKGVDFDKLSEAEQEKLIKKFRTVALKKYYTRHASGERLNKLHDKYGYTPEDALAFGKMGADKLFSGVKTVFDRLFGKDPNKEMSDAEKKFREKGGKLLSAAGEDDALGGIGAGAILGTGASFLTGGLINPILGAGLGAAVGFIKKSKTAQTLLFGEEGKQSEMQEKMQEIITKNIPGIAEGMGIGGTAGIFLGSPILGSIIGGTIGFVSSSEKAKKFLFGDEEHDTGLISKELQKKIKTALPNIGAGAIAGLIAGPFGSIAANIVLGSALGFASSTDGFKNWLFGEEKDGKREGGLLGKLKEDIADPIVGIFQKLGEEMKHGFRNLTKGLKNSISKIFEKAFGKFKDITQRPGIIGKVARFGKKLVEAPINLISKPLKGINKGLERRALRKGYGIRGKDGKYVDAATRMTMGAEYSRYAGSMGNIYDTILAGATDEQIANMSANIDEFNKTGDLASLRNIRTRTVMKINAQLSKTDLPKEIKASIIEALNNGDIETANNIATSNGIDLQNLTGEYTKANDTFNNTKNLLNKMNSALGKKKGFDSQDFADLLKQENEARLAGVNPEDRRKHILEEEIPNRINDIVSLLSIIASGGKLDPSSPLAKNINNYAKSDKIFENAVKDSDNISNEKAKDIFDDFLDGDEEAVNGAMNLRKSRQNLSLKVKLGFRSITNTLRNGIGSMFHGLFDISKSALGAVGKFFGGLFNKGKETGGKVAGGVKSIFGKVGSFAKSATKGFFKLFSKSDSADIDTETSGSGSRLAGRASDIGEGDTVTRDGEQMIIVNGQEVRKSDYEEDRAVKKALITNLPFLSGFGKIFGKDGLFAKLFKKDEDEEKEKKSIFEMLFGGKDGKLGFLNGLFSFFTGKDVLTTLGIGGALKAIGEGKGFIKGVLADAVPFAIGAAILTGLADPLGEIIGHLKIFNGDNQPDNAIDGAASNSATVIGGKQIAKDSFGNLKTDADGNYVAIDGSIVSKSAKVEGVYGEDNRLSSRVTRNIATTGIGYIARNGLGEVSSLTGLAKNTASAFTHNPVVGGMAKSASKVSTRVSNAWNKLTFKETTTATLKDGTKWVVGSGEKTFFGKGVEKLSGFARKCAEHTAKFFKGVGEALAKKFPKAAKVCEGLSQKFTEWFAENLGEETAKNAAGVLEKAAKVAYIAILVGAAINAIGNAPSYLQVTTPYRELPAGAILISVIVNVVNNAIPFVGGLIPTRVFFNFFNFAVKFAGLGDDKWFQDWEQKRAEAEAEVKAFNDETGYGFTIEEYNDYMHNNGVLTDIGNSYKAAATELKNSGYEFGDITKGMGFAANQYISDKAKELGLENGIHGIDDVSKALTIGGSMVGDIGYSMLTENLISKTLSDRIDANVEADKKKGKFNLYDSVMTGIGNGIVGMESGLQNAGNWVANKASGALNGIKTGASNVWGGIKSGATNAWNGVKNFGGNIKAGIEGFGNAVQNKIDDVSSAIHNSAPVKYAKEMVSQFGKTNELFLQAMREGDLDKLLAAKESIKAGSETGDYTQFQASMSDVQYLMLWIPTALKSVGNKINNKFEEIKTKVSAVTTKIGNIGNELFTPAFQGDISAVEKYEIPQDAASPIGKVVSGIANAVKFVAKPVAYVCSAFNKVKEKFDNLKEKTRNSSENLKNGIRELGTIMLSGDTEALDNYEYPDDGSPLSKVSGVIFSILKQTVTPVTKVSHAFHVIKDKIQEGVDKSKEAYSSFKEIIPEMWDLAKTGELTKLDSYDYSRATDAPLAGHAFGVVLGTAKTVLTPIAMVTHVGAMIKNKVADIVDNIKKGKEKYDQNMDSIANYALKGDLNSIWNGESSGGGARVGESTSSSSSPLDWIWNIATFISRIFYSVIGVVNGIGTKIKDGFENVKEGVKGFFNSIGNFFDDWLGVDYTEGKGSGIAGKGSGSFVSQFDYKGMKMGTGESVADAGCGPAVAAMAARDAGIPLSMGSAVRASDSYQTTGGTDISYFGDTMGKMGISTHTMTDKNQIYSALGGRGAILLGQDASNTTKENSPFGPGAHYVYSPGTDRNGNIIVKDPESNRPRTYSPNILNKTIAAVGVGKGSFHSAPTVPTRNFNQKRLPNHSLRSGKSTNRPAEHARIYSWLVTEAKLKDFQAAAIMGCWQAESGNTPRTIEGYYLPTFPGFEEVASRPALSNYCSGALFTAYANSGIGINRGAYQGGDGYYYPGMGLAQWTGPRGKKLLDYAEGKKWNWYDLKTQLEFFMMEMTSNYSGLYSSLKGTANLEDATEVFAAGYEHGGLRRGGSLESKYWNRVDAARGIFSTYANRPLADVSNLESSEYRGGSSGVDPREKMLEIARGELGYHEGANNFNKYSNSNVAWCGSFVRWLYEQVSDNDPDTYQRLTGVNINTQREWIPTVIPSSMHRYYKDGEVPQPGDLVAYANAGGNSVAHTGIVESVDPSSESFVGIDGNWGDAVSRTNRPYNGSVSMDQKVLWWARPNWQDAFPNGYFGTYGSSSSGRHGSSGANGSSSGNKLTDYLSGINTVFTKLFDKIFGRSDDEEESESSGDYSSSYGDYSSSGYYGDYGTSGSYASSSTTGNKGDQGDDWVWNRNTMMRPKDAAAAEAWNKAKTLDEKIKLLAAWNGRFIPKDLKMDWRDEEAAMKSKGGENNVIDWYMTRSLPLHRPTGVYVIPKDYKRFNWKKGDAAKLTPNMLGITINSASDAKNWELAKKDPGRLFRLVAKYYDREYPNNIFPSGAEYEAFDKSPNSVFDWVDNALINNTIPGSKTRTKWIDLSKSSDADVAEYNKAFNTQGYVPSLNANDATNPYKNSSTGINVNLNEGIQNTMSNVNANVNLNDAIKSNYGIGGSGSGLTEEKKKLQEAYNIKKLSGWGTTQGHSGTNRPSKSVYVGKGTNDSVNIAPVSVSSSNITPENLALLKMIVALMKQLVDNTNQVNAIFEVLKSVAESSGVNNAALLSAIGNMGKATDTSIDPGLADLKSVFDSLLLA